MAAKTSPLSKGVSQLTQLANNDLDALWRQVSTADEARDALRDVLPALVDTYGDAAGTLSADWYDGLREQSDAKRPFSATIAELPNSGGAAELAGWGVAPLYQETPDWQAAQTLIEGGLQRRIANVSRLTVTSSSVADPDAEGWVRVGFGECDWCQQYLDGEIHYTEGYDFPAHDHCNCTAIPEFSGATILGAGAPDLAAPEVESAFTPEQLRDALDPSTRRTASAIAKELEATQAGKDLTAAIKGFTETRGGVANLRKAIDKVLDGTGSTKAEAFLDAMNTYPTEDIPALFRGFAVKVEDTDEWWDAFEAQFQPGEQFWLNASSFSSSEKKAAEFSRMIGGTKKANSNYTAVRYYVEGDVSALPVEQLSKFKSEKEWITGGDFEVVGYEAATPQQPYYKVTIRQIKKLAKP